MPFGTPTQYSYPAVYGSTYVPRQEHEVLRQQNPDRNMPAGTQPYHMQPLQISNYSQGFPARVGLPTDSQLRDSQRHIGIQERRDEYPIVTGDRYHSRGEAQVPHRYHDGLRSKEDLVAELVAKMGPAGYMYLPIAREDIRLYGEPTRSDEELLAEKLADIDRKPYLGRYTAGLSVPRLRSVYPAESAQPSEQVDISQETTSRKLIHALDEHYDLDSGAEPGHRFDDVDDDIVTAYIDASAIDYGSPLGHAMQLIKDRERPILGLLSDNWIVPISFLRLEIEFLAVVLPIGQETVADVDNDILRVLYIHLANGTQDIPNSVSRASVTESCRCVLSELERRGFTDKLPNFARLRGLTDRSDDGTSGDSDQHSSIASSSKPSKASKASIDQTSREAKTSAAGEISNPKGRSDIKARERVRRRSVSTTEHVFGEASEKKKGKAPVTRVYGIDTSDHSSATSSSNTVQDELEVSSSEDSTPSVGGKATPTETISYEDSDHSSKNTKRKAHGTRSRHRSSVSDQKSHY